MAQTVAAIEPGDSYGRFVAAADVVALAREIVRARWTTAKHAQILENTLVSQRCGLCHPNSHSSSDEKIGESLSLVALGNIAAQLVESDGRQDALCMQCHKTHMPMAEHRNPHDLTAEQWQQLRSIDGNGNGPRGKLVSSATQPKLPSDDPTNIKTSCAMCHIEHHGRGFDLRAIADDRCQACHQRKFESLASGHPEITEFPNERPRWIAFSHQAHADKHFSQKNREFNCRQCHLESESQLEKGEVIRSVSFESACASCHEQPIRAASVDGWALMQLPSIDRTQATESKGLSHWPATARYGIDGQISPVLRALLSADEEARKWIDKLPDSGKLADIPNINGEREKCVETMAVAIERLIDETAEQGQRAWQARLESEMTRRMQRPLTAQDRELVTAMTTGLPPNLFQEIRSRWFQSGKSLAFDRANTKSIAKARLVSAPAESNSNGDDDLLLADPPPVTSNKPRRLLRRAMICWYQRRTVHPQATICCLLPMLQPVIQQPVTHSWMVARVAIRTLPIRRKRRPNSLWSKVQRI